MGLEAFRTGSSSNSSQSNTSQSTIDGSGVSVWREKWGKTKSELMRDGKWVKDRLDEGWDVDDFMDHLHTYSNTILYIFQRAIQTGHIEYDDIPDYDGRQYQKEELKWYVRMAVEHKQFTMVPCDISHKVGDRRVKFPDEFLEVVVEDGLDEKAIVDDSDDEDEEPSGLESFIS